jgi:hypothetical protein
MIHSLFIFVITDNISFLVVKENFSTPIQDEFCYWRHDTNILKKKSNRWSNFRESNCSVLFINNIELVIFIYDTMKDYFNSEFKSFPTVLNSHIINPLTKKIHVEYIQSVLFPELIIKY